MALGNLIFKLLHELPNEIRVVENSQAPNCVPHEYPQNSCNTAHPQTSTPSDPTSPKSPPLGQSPESPNPHRCHRTQKFPPLPKNQRPGSKSACPFCHLYFERNYNALKSKRCFLLKKTTTNKNETESKMEKFRALREANVVLQFI